MLGVSESLLPKHAASVQPQSSMRKKMTFGGRGVAARAHVAAARNARKRTGILIGRRAWVGYRPGRNLWERRRPAGILRVAGQRPAVPGFAALVPVRGLAYEQRRSLF